jgi:hypothetical protein
MTLSLAILGALVGFMVLVKLAFGWLSVRTPIASQELALSWRVIAPIAAMGVVGVVLSDRLGVPAFWGSGVSPWLIVALPAVLGLAYGAWMVVSDLPRPAPVHLEGAFSPLFYAYGAILLEVLLRLFAISVLVWLPVIAFGDGVERPAFWIAAVIAALYEPSLYMIAVAREATGLAKARALGFLVRPLFLTNVLQGYLFWTFGFLATLTFRLAAYLVWHVLYGAWLAPRRHARAPREPAPLPPQLSRSGTSARRSA